MRQTITTIELRQKLGELLDRVALRQDEFIVSRRGRPLAAMVPVAKLDQLREAARLYLLQVAGGLPTDALTRGEADRLADEAKHATRARPSKRPR